jgi:hypothetical protein
MVGWSQAELAHGSLTMDEFDIPIEITDACSAAPQLLTFAP